MTRKVAMMNRLRPSAADDCARQGKTPCKGRSIRMDKLDTLVTSHLVDRFLNRAKLGSRPTAEISPHLAERLSERSGH